MTSASRGRFTPGAPDAQRSMKAMRQVYVKSRAEWRNWLTRNHDRNAGIWLVFYKKHTGRPALGYDAAVEEASCFGWIDSIIKKLDEDRYVRKLTPRQSGSRWSKLNKARVKKLVGQGLMTESGLARVIEAKESGVWEESDRPHISSELLEELKKALAQSKQAKARFEQLAPAHKRQFIGWVGVAKRQETRNRRVMESIALLEQDKKLGLK